MGKVPAGQAPAGAATRLCHADLTESLKSRDVSTTTSGPVRCGAVESREPLPLPMALSPGTRLGPYEVTAQIDVGGMGKVYRAIDTRLKRTVAQGTSGFSH